MSTTRPAVRLSDKGEKTVRMAREKFKRFGHRDVKDAAKYVRRLRRRSRNQSDVAFLKEIRAWQLADLPSPSRAADSETLT